MKKILLYIWQLPQNLLGLLVILVTRAKYNNISDCSEENFWKASCGNFGVSLGDYIIFGKSVVTVIDCKHELGHQKQSLMLGPLYLLVIGLPSVVRNIWDRVAHKSWSDLYRTMWYYGSYPENWADRLGGISRFV